MRIEIVNEHEMNSSVLVAMDELKHLLPWWCEYVYISYHHLESDVANCSHSKDYRMLRIALCIDAMRDYDTLVDALRHEICHCYNEPLLALLDDLADFIEDESMQKIFRNIFMRRIEEQTEDLSILFRRLNENSTSNRQS